MTTSVSTNEPIKRECEEEANEFDVQGVQEVGEDKHRIEDHKLLTLIRQVDAQHLALIERCHALYNEVRGTQLQ